VPNLWVSPDYNIISSLSVNSYISVFFGCFFLSFSSFVFFPPRTIDEPHTV